MKDDLLVGVFGLAKAKQMMKPPIVLILKLFLLHPRLQKTRQKEACAKDISCFVAEKLEKLHHLDGVVQNR